MAVYRRFVEWMYDPVRTRSFGKGRIFVLAFIVVSLIISFVGFYGIHSGWTRDAQSVVVQYILAILAVVAGLIALWNIIFTRSIVELTSKQTHILSQQFRVSNMPHIDLILYTTELIDFMKASPEASFEDIMSTTLPSVSRAAEVLRSFLILYKDESVRFLVLLDNPLDNIALDVWCYIYDYDSKQYLGAEATYSALLPHSTRIFIFPSKEVLSEEQMRSMLSSINKKLGRVEHKTTKTSPTNTIQTVVMYRSLDGVQYFRNQSFTIHAAYDANTEFFKGNFGYTSEAPTVTYLG